MPNAIYFNGEHLPQPEGQYVLWCDVMGASRQLVSSIHVAANHIFRLHSAFASAVQGTDAYTYAVMDGVFVACASRDQMIAIIRTAFCLLAQQFVAAKGAQRMFMVRGGLAFGPALHGRDVPPDAFFGEFGDGRVHSEDEYSNSTLPLVKDQLMLSPAMAWAHAVESSAPPFGVFVHESALAMPQAVSPDDHGFSSYLFRWWPGDDDGRKLAALTAHQVDYYLANARGNSQALGYSRDRIQRHRDLAIEYFGNRWPT